jgi:hypothetical protein
MKVPELSDRPEVLRNICRPRDGHNIDALSEQLILLVSHEAAKLLRNLLKPSFAVQDDAKLVVPLR